MYNWLKIGIILMFGSPALHAQDSILLELPGIVELAIRNNNGLQARELEVSRQTELVRQGYNWDKTNLYYNYDENNIAENGAAIRVWGVRQSFAFPTVYHAGRQALLSNVNLTKQQYELAIFDLKKKVSHAFYKVAYFQALQNRYEYLDSLYRNFSNAAKRRFETGESNYLERITAEAKMKEVELMLNRNKQQLSSAYLELQKQIQSDSTVIIPGDSFDKEIPPSMLSIENHPGVQLWGNYEDMADWQTRTEKNKLLPDLAFSYFQGTNNDPDARLYQGFEVGIAVPIFYGTQKGLIRAGQIQQNIYSKQKENYITRLQAERNILINRLTQIQESLDYYENNGRNLVQEIIRTSQRSFQEGEIDYFQFIQSIDNAVRIEISYLENLLEYNQTVIDLQYLTIEP